MCSVLVGAGHIVAAVSSDAERLASVDATSTHVCDLTNFTATTQLAAHVGADHGTIDGLVHLVGGWRGGHEPADWDWLEPRILTTLRNATLAFHDELTASDAGRLVTVGSIAAAKPTWGGANYTVLKSAGDAWVAAVASGWRKGGTAAAVTFEVQSLGGDGTPVETLAANILPLWESSATEVNGTRIDLTPKK